MTKKKRLINALIFIGGLIVFLFYYFEDKGDMNKVEKEQDQTAVEAADTMINELNESFDDLEFEDGNFEVSPSAIEGDSIVSDSL